MSLPPYREPFLLNKFLDAESTKEFGLRRPGLGSFNFCDPAFFKLLDPKNPFTDSRFPRYKHSDFLYSLPREAVTEQDSPRSSPRWGETICNRHSKWRTSFPDRMPRLEGNDSMKVSGPATFKPGLESIPDGSKSLSERRLRWMENTRGGKIFETRARDERWDRYREGAGPITRTKFEFSQPVKRGGVYGTFRKATSMPKFWSESEVNSGSAGGAGTPVTKD